MKRVRIGWKCQFGVAVFDEAAALTDEALARVSRWDALLERVSTLAAEFYVCRRLSFSREGLL